MPDPVTGAAAIIGSLKSLYEIAKELRNNNDPERLRLAGSQMLELVIAAREQAALLQEEGFALRAEIDALKTKIKGSDSFESQKDGYVLEQTPAGGFAYYTKGLSGSKTDAPAYCQNCFGKQKLAVLQPLGLMQMGKCPECGSHTKLH